MLRVAAEGIVATGDELKSFLPIVFGQLLYRQSSPGARLQGIADDLGRVFAGLGRWLREPARCRPVGFTINWSAARR